MARLTRFTQKVFGSSASANQIAEFGSLAAGTPARFSGATITPAIVQGLNNYLQGWFSAVVGTTSPAIEDQNALNYLWGYQLSYLMQAGLAEWDSGTTYYINNTVNNNGTIYLSLIDNNLNNIPSSNPSDWAIIAGRQKVPTTTSLLSGTGTYTTPTNPAPLYLKVRISGGGGGGRGGSAAGTSGGDGGNGGTTTFGSSLLTATGGMGGSVSNTGGGAGGTATVNSPALQIIALTGGTGGGDSSILAAGSNSAVLQSGAGGNNPLGGAGGSVQGGVGITYVGINGSVNTGSGASGGSGDYNFNSVVSGEGGGAGGYLEARIPFPSSTYAYSVGASGTAGTAGTNGAAGGTGGSGIIIVEEFYS